LALLLFSICNRGGTSGYGLQVVCLSGGGKESLEANAQLMPLAFALYGNQPDNKAVEGSIMGTARKIERIEARLQPAQKERIEYAASLMGTSVSDFMVQSAEAAAVVTIREHEAWTLTTQDRDLFVSALLNPPEPNERIRAAARRYMARRT
jgi:uncharacterized protein (DUF1778 family)